MTYPKPPIHEYITDKRVSRAWSNFFSRLISQLNGPQRLPSYEVLTVPDAASYTGFLIYVSDETGGAVPAFSDGTNWRRVTDRAIVS